MSRRRLAGQVALIGFSVCASAWSRAAHADLEGDVRALQSARAAYGAVLHLAPRLLEHGERLPLSIPPAFLDPKDASCTTVSVLGVSGLHFLVRFSSFDPGAPSSAFPEVSRAGASEIIRCGSTKPFLSSVFLEMRSPRGLLELLISNAPAGTPRLIEILPSRDPGVELPLGDPGARPAQPPLAARLERLRARAEREGALSFQRDPVRAGDDGTGTLPLTLDAGCHELTLLGGITAGTPAVDLDLELLEVDGGSRLALDRADDADGALSVCLGSATRVELRFLGAMPNAGLSLAQAHFGLPLGLPSTWGPEPRARFAALARARHLGLQTPPVYSSLGVQGTTELPFEVIPGACYSVLLAPLRGEVRNLSLSVLALSPSETPRGAADTDGSAVSFCAGGARRAALEVVGEGPNLSWLLSVWESGRAAIGVRER